MNCRPGDLAVIIRADDTPENIGAIVEVLHAAAGCVCGCHGDKLVWMVETRGRKLVGYNLFNMRLSATTLTLGDECLRPIRDPGEEAIDQVVEGLGAAPKTLTEVREVQHG